VAIPETLPALRADGIKLKQMLLNLMTNAIKFTPIGGMVRLTAWIEPPGGPWAGSLAVAVADTGIGMRPEEIPTALEPFRRLEAGRALRNLGTGLGLPIAKAQIEMHGGVLEIDSRPGAGTRVTLRFPANRVVRTETPAALGAEPAADAPSPAAGASVA
jgi:signal transduction histidine kinase